MNTNKSQNEYLEFILNTQLVHGSVDDKNLSMIKLKCGNLENKNITNMSNITNIMKSVPEEYVCPISYVIMDPPVMDPTSGKTYDKKCLIKWVNENGTSPETRKEISIENIKPNLILRDIIEKWKKENPNIISQYNKYVKNVENSKKSCLLIIIDNSLSMRRRCELKDAETYGFSRLDLAKHTAKSIVKAFDGYLTLIVFNSKITTKCTTLNMSNENNKENVIRDIDNIYPEGCTNFYGVLNKIEEKLQNKSDDMIYKTIILTDGAPYIPYGDYEIENQLTNDHKLNGYLGKKIDNPIWSISFGNDADIEFLENLSRFTNGRTFYISDISMLAQKFIYAFALSTATVLDEVEIELTPKNNVEIDTSSDIFKAYEWKKNGNTISRKIGSLFYGQELNILVPIKDEYEYESDNEDAIRKDVEEGIKESSDEYLREKYNIGVDEEIDYWSIMDEEIEQIKKQNKAVFNVRIKTRTVKGNIDYDKNYTSSLDENDELDENYYRVLLSNKIRECRKLMPLRQYGKVRKDLQNFIDNVWKSNDENLTKDLTGQIYEAFNMTNNSYYDDWGKNFTLTIQNQHLLMYPDNSKDGSSIYGKGDFLKKQIEKANNSFNSLKPPENLTYQDESSNVVRTMSQVNNTFSGNDSEVIIRGVCQNGQVVSVNVINSGCNFSHPDITFAHPRNGGNRARGYASLNSNGGILSVEISNGGSGYENDEEPGIHVVDRDISCYHGDCITRMENGDSEFIKNIKSGDKIQTSNNEIATVEYILKTDINKKTNLVKLKSGCIITPWHPIYRNNEYIFPFECDDKENILIYTEAVYSFVLDKGHIMYVNGEQTVTLGHNLPGLIHHQYFGTQKVIDDIKKYANKDNIAITDGSIRKDDLIEGLKFKSDDDDMNYMLNSMKEKISNNSNTYSPSFIKQSWDELYKLKKIKYNKN